MAGSPRLRVLVCGGGIAGQAVAFWLARGGHDVVVAERFPALRASGAQVDLRDQGIEAVEAMGLLDAARARLVDEPGVALVDSRGRRRMTITANTSGRGRQSLTSEYEIMRGDLVRLLHDATRDDVQYRFGVGVESFEQQPDRVLARFSDGSSETYDLLVGADGQGSRIRRALLQEGTTGDGAAGAAGPYRRLGVHTAYFFIPRTAADGAVRETYAAGRGRQIMRRSHNPTDTQVYFFLRETSAEASAVHRLPVAQQKQFWAGRFRDAGWQTDRFLDGMQTAQDFYSQEVLQVRSSTWSAGRVVLVGDAAHCASPFSGMGVSAGLVGAHVLAGQINAHPDDLATAFAAYDTSLRPFVDTVQDGVDPRLLAVGMPQTRLAVTALLTAAGVAGALRLPELYARFVTERATEDRGGAWVLPPDPAPVPAR